jgi:hypothetical protein
MAGVKTFVQLLVVLGVLVATAPVFAADDSAEVRPYSPYYTGAFLAAGAFAGEALIQPAGGSGSWEPAYGAWLQASAPLQVIDVQLAWHGSSFSSSGLHVRQDSFAALVGAHPFFLLHLESSPIFYALGSVYLLAGVDVDWVSLRRHADSAEASDAQLGYQVGAGFDLPLGEVDDGGSFWLGLQVKRNSFELTPAPHQPVDVDQYVLALRLSYRSNGLLFVF